MARPLTVYHGLMHRSRVPGLQRHRQQMDVMIAVRSKAEAMRVLQVSRGTFNDYWGVPDQRKPECLQALANPGVIFYRPLDAIHSPYVPWDQEYPREHIPSHLAATPDPEGGTPK